MNKENCALKLVDEIILYYDARSKKRQITCKQVTQKLFITPEIYGSTPFKSSSYIILIWIFTPKYCTTPYLYYKNIFKVTFL